MEKNYNTDDTFLARWISGDLPEAERIAFEKTDAYKQFSIINKESQLLKGPEIDTEAALKQVKLKLQQKRKKQKVIRLQYAIAASVILLISLGFFFNSSKTYSTKIGEKLEIALNDGSKVHLNANSSLSHKRFFWSNNKEVYLKGEAYFVVEKSGRFRVNTSKGHVDVLGTKFNIKDRSELIIKCFEGKVGFTPNTDSSETHILTKGMQIETVNKDIKQAVFTDKTPDWKQDFSKFSEQPLSKVLEELTNFFSITFEENDVNTDRLFSGSFSHKNLDAALKTTLIPMGIKYKKSSNNNTIILSE